MVSKDRRTSPNKMRERREETFFLLVYVCVVSRRELNSSSLTPNRESKRDVVDVVVVKRV
jgi:hypothetical protein